VHSFRRVTICDTTSTAQVIGDSLERAGLEFLNPLEERLVAYPVVGKQFHELLQDFGAALLPTGP
jgi:hypothetical protein